MSLRFGKLRLNLAGLANRLADIAGGYVLVRDRAIVAELPLPIAGLMSDRPIEEIAQKMAELEEKLVEVLGCPRLTSWSDRRATARPMP